VALPTDNADLTAAVTGDPTPQTPAALSWTLKSTTANVAPNTAAVTFSNAAAAATNARFVAGPGTYVLTATATDDSALTGAADVTITVASNPNVYPDPSTATTSGFEALIGVPDANGLVEGVDVNMVKLGEAFSKQQAAATALAAPYPNATTPTANNEAGIVLRHGKVVYSWGDPNLKFDVQSATKSIGGLSVFLGLDENKIALSDKVASRFPAFAQDPLVATNGFADPAGSATVLQLATHTSGLSKSDSPNQTRQFLSQPGSTWLYSDQALNWLGDTMTSAYAQDLNDLLFNRVFNTLGIRPTADLRWRTNANRTPVLPGTTSTVRRELASGIQANAFAMARIGLLMLRQGVWKDQPIVSNASVKTAQTPPPEVAPLAMADPANFPGATTTYGVLFWTNAIQQSSTIIPADTFWAWGQFENFIFVIPSLDMVVVRIGTYGWRPDKPPTFWNADYTVFNGFLEPIVQAVKAP
jgi:CubicO group peptidase (beta-lactamase class C family)